jgi:2-polyprenyl-3-methyl-5-hydroxy-6-metoxy-1,4-benzoquinol methylase
MLKTAAGCFARLKELLKKSGLFPSFSARERLASRHLRGTGLEIGALHFPLRVPSHVTVKYVDIASREENIKAHTDVPGEQIVETDYLEDGFVLTSIPDQSQDFLIANHVLEHSSNPLQTLVNWSRVLREGGKLFITIPIAARCFDRERPLTTLEHLVQDYRLCLEVRSEEFSAANRSHFREWLSISDAEVLKTRGVDGPLSEAELVRRVDDMVAKSTEIHYHTFSAASYSDLLTYFVEHIDRKHRVLEIRKSRGGGEWLAILQKTSSN